MLQKNARDRNFRLVRICCEQERKGTWDRRTPLRLFTGRVFPTIPSRAVLVRWQSALGLSVFTLQRGKNSLDLL